MKTAKFWDGEDLKGIWEITRKIDGIRALRSPNGVVSRNGEPLYNLVLPEGITDAEIFCGSWEKTMTALRTKDLSPVPVEYIYSLDDPLDERLYIDEVFNPHPDFITDTLEEQVYLGYEGLVLRQGDVWIKIKPSETIDIRVKGITLGKGKHSGKLGAFITEMGKVGSGFTDTQREEYNDPSFIGKMIEVEYTGITKDHQFRHARFKRIRYDK